MLSVPNQIGFRKIHVTMAPFLETPCAVYCRLPCLRSTLGSVASVPTRPLPHCHTHTHSKPRCSSHCSTVPHLCFHCPHSLRPPRSVETLCTTHSAPSFFSPPSWHWLLNARLSQCAQHSCSGHPPRLPAHCAPLLPQRICHRQAAQCTVPLHIICIYYHSS